MSTIGRRAGLLLGLLLGCLSALAIVGMGLLPNPALVLLLFPGLMLSMGVLGFHAFAIWVAALGNLLFWLLLFWLVGLLVDKLRRLRGPSGTVD